MTSDLEAHLKKWFGYNSFRPLQRDIVEGVLQGKDVVAILPTGAGKSLCYQLPALLAPGVAVVVSPLISLMQDQVSALIKGGISATYINSSLPMGELYEILSDLSRYKLLYISPERFSDGQFLDRLKSLPLSFFVVDEAHCISQWGHSFRPDYRELSLIKNNFPDKPLMALTATATPDVEKDIIHQLAMKEPLIAKGSFDRPNLMIRIDQKIDILRQIKVFLDKRKDQSGIIYAATRKGVDELYEWLKAEGFNVGKYHAGLADNERTSALRDFIHDKTQLMVATVAFGMGINKPDIRFILHRDMPRTIEQYYQEIGRAGRDGLAAECLMLYSGQDLAIYKSFCKSEKDPAIRAQIEKKTELMYSLCQTYSCRRIKLLNYFGEPFPKQDCQGCDRCVDEEATEEGTLTAQKILSCVYRLKEGFGIKQVIDVLRGSKGAHIISRGHDRLSTYNLLSEFSELELRHYIDSLLAMGYLKISQGNYPCLQLTETSRDVLKGNKTVKFRKKIFKEKAKPKSSLPYNEALFQKLRQLRLALSRDEKLPPFTIFNDKSLIEMATYFPKTDDAFLSINGVGQNKLKSYGERFLNSIKEFCRESGV